MEQTDSGECHSHSILITGLNYIIITDGTTWLGDVFDAALISPVNVVAKWEECVRTQGHVSHLV